MNKTVILVLGGFAAIIICSLPFIYSGMKAKDYNNLYSGIQNAKRKAGMWIEEDYKNKKVQSYSDRYVRGDFNE